MALVERAKAANDLEQARDLLQEALGSNPNCSHAHLFRANLALPDIDRVLERLHRAAEATK